MSIEVVRAILLADDQTQAQVGDRIGPLQAIINEKPPYIVLSLTASEPFNDLQGSSGLNRAEVELSAWAKNYDQAVTIAKLARKAIEAAGHYTLHEPGDGDAFQQDLVLYKHGYVFQVFES